MNNFLLALLLFLFFFAIFAQFIGHSSQEDIIKAKDKEIAQLKQQCTRLRQDLSERSQQAEDDLKQDFFSQLQTLLVNYPTASKMAQKKPDLPAKNLVALLTPLSNLLSAWGYNTIGEPWAKVTYDPQIHQADTDTIQVGEEVYIRFVGYRDRDKILVPAKVSHCLPPGIKEKED